MLPTSIAATNVLESPTFVIQPSRKKEENEIDLDDFISSLEADEESAEKMADARRWLAKGLEDDDLRSLRLSVGLSQSQLAKAVGLQQPNISAIESGKRRPEYETALKLAQALNTNVEKIYSLWRPAKEA